MLATQPILFERDWGLIIDLLESERQQLPTEVHHTDNRDMARELADRRLLVEDLLGRLRPGSQARPA